MAWDSVTNATTYRIRWTGQTEATQTTLTRTVTGLTAGTPYVVQVRAEATGYASSAYTTITFFTYGTVAGLTVSPKMRPPSAADCIAGVFTVDWFRIDGLTVTGYEYAVDPANPSSITADGTITQPATGDPSVTLTGRAEETDYAVYVRSATSAGTYGIWVPAVCRLPKLAPTPYTYLGGTEVNADDWNTNIRDFINFLAGRDTEASAIVIEDTLDLEARAGTDAYLQVPEVGTTKRTGSPVLGDTILDATGKHLLIYAVTQINGLAEWHDARGGSVDITYETLKANGDVGTGEDQFAQGNHTH